MDFIIFYVNNKKAGDFLVEIACLGSAFLKAPSEFYFTTTFFTVPSLMRTMFRPFLASGSWRPSSE